VNDPRCLDDACYLLGALSPVDRQEYRRHLRTCPRCQESLQHLASVLNLLALAVPDDADNR
jgi:anti-sigma factor RsiW